MSVTQSKIIYVERQREHDVRVAVEVQLALDEGLGVWIPPYSDHVPDLLVVSDSDEIPLEVKTVDGRLRGTVPRKQFDDFAQRYDNLVLALWADAGRIRLTPRELTERFVRTRTGDLVHNGREGRPDYYLFDCATDSFRNPFRDWLSVVPEAAIDERALQLTLDNRAVRNVNARKLGETQKEIVRVLTYRGGLTSTEVGTLAHALHGSCPAWQRDGQYRSEYGGAGCCRKAVDLGSTIMGLMRDQGRVWKDGEYWRLVPAWNA